jgi:hypothetical protein
MILIALTYSGFEVPGFLKLSAANRDGDPLFYKIFLTKKIMKLSKQEKTTSIYMPCI